MCNDNGSYWQGYLGYPAIAFLMSKNIIPYSSTSTNFLKDIMWKDINTKFKNDWDKTEKYCQNLVVERGDDLNLLMHDIRQIHTYLADHPLSYLGKKTKPPSGY
jgi:hypothetical protein